MSAPLLLDALRQRGWSVATAESLTGGLVCGELTSVPGASDVVRGGVVAYSRAVKASVLGVDADLLDRVGAVDAQVAREMATGVCRVLGCAVGVATTGVAGPDPSDGQEVGTVFVAVAAPGVIDGAVVRRLSLAGAREDVRRGSVDAVLELAVEVVLAGAAREHLVSPGTLSGAQGTVETHLTPIEHPRRETP